MTKTKWILLVISIFYSVSAMAHKEEKIAVVGAGLAGLTVAYRLHQKGYDVEVFEARSRVGGRVQSALIRNFDGEYSIAELGGENILDGGKATHFLSLAKEFNLDVNYFHFGNGKFYDGNQFYDHKAVFLELLHRDKNIIQKIEQAAKESSNIQEVIDKVPLNQLQKRMLTFMMNAYEGLPPKLLSTDHHNVETLLMMMSIETESESIYERASLKKGNAMLPIKLEEKLGSRIHYNKVLKQVKHNSNAETSLIFSDGTSTACNKLILAIPSSTYKNIHFDKHIIGSERLEKINSILYGESGKIIVPLKKSIESQEWFFTDDMAVFLNGDHKLFTLYFKLGTKENLSSDDTIHKANLVLNKYKKGLFNDSYPIQALDQHYKKYDSPVWKSWISDVYAKGSYSAFDSRNNDLRNIVRYENIDVLEMFVPIDNHLFFVGEHTTILDEIGTMEAAVESGDRISELFE